MQLFGLLLFASPWIVAIVGLIFLRIFPGHSYGTTKPHSANHPGITVNTLSGKKDIICPKCKCPYCSYYYDYEVTPLRARTRTKVHLLNPFKPLIEDVTTFQGGQIIEKEKYQCNNCGYIFR